jgi:hypothetical protein
MLTSKFWIERDGTVTDTSTTEHAVLAREKILGLEPGDPLRTASPFYQLTKEDVKRLMKRRPHQIELYDVAAKRMLDGEDPRWIFIQDYDAIRVAKAGFWCWDFTQEIRDRIRMAEEYWKKQTSLDHVNDIIEIIAVKPKESFEVPVRLIRNGKVSLSELRKFKVNAINDLTPE